ncbi:hypothetical protein [Flavivirga algicola]|uniref:VWA domain-containing protein n=1 Tax=Flavivirga algicola TaxID=2729136 RepID=A0ABX1RWN4_9FLAO|nr:hypothetical protein [Flavivirga algicola]NMH87990.1 hypothetical protein [Flavivirga algicola]
MEEYLILLFEAFGNYMDTVSESQQWWLVPTVLIGIWLLSFTVSKFIKESIIVTREFKILIHIIMYSIAVELLLVIWFMYHWLKTDVYQSDTEKLIHLLSIVVCIVVQIISYKRLANGFKRESILQNINCPATRQDLKGKNKAALQRFKKIKLWSFIPAFGFLLLFLPIKMDKNLVSFLLDTSSSMDVHIGNGQEILRKSFQNINNDTDIILSWFTENSPSGNFNDLIRTRNSQQLDGMHQYFTNKHDAINALNGIEFTEGTPLLETIWSNYLFTLEHIQNEHYTNNIFVLVTDGEDSYFESEISTFLCEIPQFNNFYQDNINIINLQGANNAFFDKADACNYAVYEGMDIDSYAAAVQEILAGITKDYYFPVWLAVFCALGMLIVLFIKPKKY